MEFTLVPSGFKKYFIFLCFLQPMTSVYAQFAQIGSKQVGTGAVGNAFQGYSVAISSDGNTAIVGGYADSAHTGAAWVYTHSGGTWKQQGGKLVGTGAARYPNQGNSVSISSDGNTAIVGGTGDSAESGAAWVFIRTGEIWTQQGSKLVGTGAVGAALQGSEVAISSDGNTAIVGGSGDNGEKGAAWIYTRSGAVWSQQGGKLVGSGWVGNPLQGGGVAISSDGNTAIIGGSGDFKGKGAAWVFTRSGGAWTQQGSKLVGSDASGDSQQGVSVALSSDGNTAIIGGYADSSYRGAAWIFTRSDGTWSQQGSKLFARNAVGFAQQGYSVSITSDGNTAIVGGFGDDNNTGAAWVWTRSGGTWSQQGGKLVGDGSVGYGWLGYSVSLSSDGNTTIIGGPYDNIYAGAAWIFSREGTPIAPREPFRTRLNLTSENSLQFSLLQNEQVTIDLYSAKGEWHTRPLNEFRKAGNYSIHLPTESKGRVNFLEYRAGNYHETLIIKR